jgi:hypothetical protein
MKLKQTSKLGPRLKLGFDPRQNVSLLDRLGSVLDPKRNLHLLKYDIMYRPFGKAINKKVKEESGIATIDCMGRRLRFRAFFGIGSILHEVFVQQPYMTMDVKGRRVIDVGATIGDSAIYLLLKGARHVDAYEAYDGYYRYLSQNLKLNRMSGKVAAHKAFVTSLNGMDVRDGDILKMDVEGAEYGILDKTPDAVLVRFSEMAMEYHYGYLNIKRKLEALGFSVEVTRPQRAMENGRGFAGMLYAKRQRNATSTASHTV